MNSLVLSGTDKHVLSGTRETCHQEHFQGTTLCVELEIGASNFTNRDSNLYFWGQAPVENHLGERLSTAGTRSGSGLSVGTVRIDPPLVEEAAP